MMEWQIHATTSDKDQAYRIAGRVIREDKRRAGVVAAESLRGAPFYIRTQHTWAVLADVNMTSPGLAVGLPEGTDPTLGMLGVI